MKASIHAEFIRVVSTPALATFLLAGLGVGIFLTGGLILMGPENMNPPMAGPDTLDGLHGLLGVLVLGAPVPVLLGTRVMTDEQEHRTIVPTLLAQPRRYLVVTAKLVVAAAAGAGYGLCLSAGAMLGLYGGSALGGFVPAESATTVVVEVLRIGVAMMLYTVIGVGIGALIPRATACLAVAVGWFYLVESTASAVPGVQALYPWFPGGAASSITGQSFVLDAISRTTGGPPVQLLPEWLGAVVLLAYAVAASFLALGTTLRRDVH